MVIKDRRLTERDLVHLYLYCKYFRNDKKIFFAVLSLWMRRGATTMTKRLRSVGDSSAPKGIRVQKSRRCWHQLIGMQNEFCAWITFKLVKPYTKYYCTFLDQLNAKLREISCEGEKIFSHQDNAPTQIAQKTVTKISKLTKEFPAYSPDLATSDF